MYNVHIYRFTLENVHIYRFTLEGVQHVKCTYIFTITLESIRMTMYISISLLWKVYSMYNVHIYRFTMENVHLYSFTMESVQRVQCTYL